MHEADCSTMIGAVELDPMQDLHPPEVLGSRKEGACLEGADECLITDSSRNKPVSRHPGVADASIGSHDTHLSL